MRYDYKVVPAPDKGEKAKGARGAEARFAAAVERVMNAMANDGWEYQRSETLPCEERSVLSPTQVVWRNLLVFRKPCVADVETFRPRVLAAPDPKSAPKPEPKPVQPTRPARPVQARGRAETDEGDGDGEDSLRAALPPALMARAQRLRAQEI